MRLDLKMKNIAMIDLILAIVHHGFIEAIILKYVK